MKMALLTFTFGLFLSLIAQAEAVENKGNKREVAGMSESGTKKKSSLDGLRNRLQGYKGSVRI